MHEQKTAKKRMWSKRVGNELYVFHNGEIIYKKWLGHKQPSVLFNKKWPNVFIV